MSREALFFEALTFYAAGGVDGGVRAREVLAIAEGPASCNSRGPVESHGDDQSSAGAHNLLGRYVRYEETLIERFRGRRDAARCDRERSIDRNVERCGACGVRTDEEPIAMCQACRVLHAWGLISHDGVVLA